MTELDRTPEEIRPVAGHHPVWERDECHPGHPRVLVCGVDRGLWPCEIATAVIATLRDNAAGLGPALLASGGDVAGLLARAEELEAANLTGRGVTGG